MPFHSRRLPHWQPEGKSLFLTWSLRGSLPHNRFPPPESPSAGKAFVWMDRCLDEARSGPTWLKRPDIAQVVVDTLRYGSVTLRYYDLHAYVVMPNHVHVLLSPLTTPSKLLQSVKGFSAREANKILARSGEPFWQPESYDHWVRDAAEFERIRNYTEENPVRAGLAPVAEDYSWSSAFTGGAVKNARGNAGMAGPEARSTGGGDIPTIL
ncbi:MAG: transposase [Bryobacteraceae bacterium]